MDVDVPGYERALAEWLGERRRHSGVSKEIGYDFDERVADARVLQHDLFAAGWNRYGWPVELGGLGGSWRHRAVLWEQIARAGVAEPTIFEHVEILAPMVAKHGHPDVAARLIPQLLDGSAAWSQGFSEPDAGSDLANLRTTGNVDGDLLIVRGRKIWTSWSKYARYCIALVRTGPADGRHHGLTMVVIDLESSGVTVEPVRQANGSWELAEVLFDDVVVPIENIIGGLGGGWAMALEVLTCERSTLAWMRHCFMHARLDSLRHELGQDDEDKLGDVALDMLALRASALNALIDVNTGSGATEESSFVKLLMTSAEQSLYDLAQSARSADLAFGRDVFADELRHEYFFSRIVTVYGGSRQMQLNTIAKRVLGMPT